MKVEIKNCAYKLHRNFLEHFSWLTLCFFFPFFFFLHTIWSKKSQLAVILLERVKLVEAVKEVSVACWLFGLALFSSCLFDGSCSPPLQAVCTSLHGASRITRSSVRRAAEPNTFICFSVSVC